MINFIFISLVDLIILWIMILIKGILMKEFTVKGILESYKSI